MDRHLTMANHIDATVTKCHGLLGVLRRAAVYLPEKLLKLVYTSIIRSHLEYSSALIHCAAPTHLAKLDTVQKIASRIITNSDSRAHSAPLQTLLGLEPLDSRRKKHIYDIVADIQRNDSHPYFQDFFKDSIHNSLEKKTSIA